MSTRPPKVDEAALRHTVGQDVGRLFEAFILRALDLLNQVAYGVQIVQSGIHGNWFFLSACRCMNVYVEW